MFRNFAHLIRMHQVRNIDIHPLDRMAAMLCGAREFELAILCSPSNAALKCCVTHACPNITRIFLQLYEMGKTCTYCMRIWMLLCVAYMCIVCACMCHLLHFVKNQQPYHTKPTEKNTPKPKENICMFASDEIALWRHLSCI